MDLEMFELPWPNSDNNHHMPIILRGSRHLSISLTRDAREYRKLVKMIMGFRHPDRVWGSPVSVTIHLYPPRKGCDTNNYWKSLQDALTHAGVWTDDRIVVESHAFRHRPVGRNDAKVQVIIKSAEAPDG